MKRDQHQREVVIHAIPPIDPTHATGKSAVGASLVPLSHRSPTGLTLIPPPGGAHVPFDTFRPRTLIKTALTARIPPPIGPGTRDTPRKLCQTITVRWHLPTNPVARRVSLPKRPDPPSITIDAWAVGWGISYRPPLYTMSPHPHRRVCPDERRQAPLE